MKYSVKLVYLFFFLINSLADVRSQVGINDEHIDKSCHERYQLIDALFKNRSELDSYQVVIDSITNLLEFYQEYGFSNDSIIGRCYYLRGILLGSDSQQRYKEAIAEFHLALESFEDYYGHLHARVYSTHWYLANRYLVIDDYEAALHHVLQSIEIQLQVPKPTRFDRSFALLGEIRGALGDIRSVEICKALARNVYDSERIMLGETLRTVGESAEAIRFLNQLDVDSVDLGIKYSVMAQSYQDMGEIDSAFQYFLKEESLINSDDYWSKAWLASNRADLLSSIGQFASAITLYREALILFEEAITHPSESVETLIGLAHTYAKMEDFVRAEKIEELLWITLRDFSHPPLYLLLLHRFVELDNLWLRYQYDRSVSVLKSATDKFASALKFLELERNSHADEISRRNILKFSQMIIDVGIKIYAECHELEGGQRYAVKILQLMDLNRGNLLLDHISDQFDDVTWSIDTLVTDLIDKLNKSMIAGEIGALKDSLAKVFLSKPGLFDIPKPLTTKRPNAIGEFYNENENVLSYFQHNDRSLSIIKIEANICSYRSISETSWYSNMNVIIEEAKQKDRPLNDSLVERVRFLTSFDSTISEARVFPDGLLLELPFELLVSPDVDVSYGFSLATLRYQKSSANERISGLAFAPFTNIQQAPMEGSYALSRLDTGVLTHSYDEVAGITELGLPCEVYFGSDANRQNFLDEAVTAGFLHLATHAVANTEESGPPMIFMSGHEREKHISMPDITMLNLETEMVVISACQTGQGEYVAGEGVLSLAHSFAYAGAKSVIASLWAVNDKSTSEIMISFYKFLKKGHRKDTALRLAKQEYLDNTHDPRFRHPYYWAGFIAIGDMSPLDFGNPSDQWWMLGIGGILLLVSLAAYRYFK